MEALFTALTHAVEGSAALATGAALLWGILSVVLSPCHLVSLPLIVGFIDEQGRTSTRHAFWLSTLFAAGILVPIGVIGAVTAALGHMMGRVGPWASYFVAAVFLVVGLHLLGVIPLPLPGAATPGLRRKSLLAALVGCVATRRLPDGLVLSLTVTARKPPAC
jgi:cytochrome c-type biogenesis protein